MSNNPTSNKDDAPFGDSSSTFKEDTVKSIPKKSTPPNPASSYLQTAYNKVTGKTGSENPLEILKQTAQLGLPASADDISEFVSRSIKMQQGDQNRKIGKMFLAATGLAEEVGEVCRIITRAFYRGEDLKDAELIEELGDVLCFVAMMAQANNLDMEDIIKQNHVKIKIDTLINNAIKNRK